LGVFVRKEGGQKRSIKLKQNLDRVQIFKIENVQHYRIDAWKFLLGKKEQLITDTLPVSEIKD
jgi:hypothetical protein